MKYLSLAVVAALALLLFFAASCEKSQPPSDKLAVAVTILPQAEFVKEVGGDRVEVTVLVPAGANLHAYEPTPSQITGLSRAGIYVKVGSGIEFELAWMDKLISANKDMLVIDCSRGIQLMEMDHEHEGEGEHHDENNEQEHEDEHGHEGSDPHIWLSPENAAIMVQNIYDGLVTVDPSNKDYYRENRDAYLEELSRLDREIRDALSGVSGRTFMVYHPSFGYFAREYDLTMLSVEEEGKEPAAAGLARVIVQAKEHNLSVIFTEPQFDPRNAEVIADAIGGRVVSIDPLAGNYLDNMRRFLVALVESMS